MRQVSHHGPPPTSTAQVEERASISGAALRSPPLPRSHTRMRTCMPMRTGFRISAGLSRGPRCCAHRRCRASTSVSAPAYPWALRLEVGGGVVQQSLRSEQKAGIILWAAHMRHAMII